MPFAWVLNLDAEEELAAGAAWRRRTALWRAIAPQRSAAARALLGPGDVRLAAGGTLDARLAWTGRAWCPTPSARAALAAGGAEPEPAPAVEVLRRVNQRGFLLRAGWALAGARLLHDDHDWRSLRRLRAGRTWRLKRGLAAAGRGQRVLVPSAASGADEDWVRGALVRGPVLAEPELDRRAEFATHGWVTPAGVVHLGPPRLQTVGRDGAWRATGAACDADRARPLARAAGDVGHALADAGYHGPFGLDAIAFCAPGGRPGLHVASDLNARFTMGWRDPRGPGV